MSYQTTSTTVTGKNLHWEKLTDATIPQLRIHGCGFSPRIDNWASNGDIIRPFWCLWYALDNGSWIESDGIRWNLGPEYVVLKPAQVVYSRHNSQSTPQLWLHFSLEPEYTIDAPEPYVIPLDSLLREQVTVLLDIYHTAQKIENRVLYHYVAALLNNCFARHPLHLRTFPDALRLVLHKIDSAPAADLSNASLARLANLSMSSFIKLFKLYMNQPPATYVRATRYQKASRMLIFSDLSIEQIAAAMGYPNRHYFSRDFAIHAGCGPATFRKQQLK